MPGDYGEDAAGIAMISVSLYFVMLARECLIVTMGNVGRCSTMTVRGDAR